jgi:hypothetical protein
MEAAISCGESQLRENDDSHQLAPNVIMALDMCDDGTLGCAFFDSLDGSLQVAEDVPQSSVDVSEHFATHAHPNLLLVSGRAPQDFLDYLQRSMKLVASFHRINSWPFSNVIMLTHCRYFTISDVYPNIIVL